MEKVLDSKSSLCIANNGKNTNHTSHISRRAQFVINGEKCEIHKIDWCEGVPQLAYMATKNVGYNFLNPRMKYISW